MRDKTPQPGDILVVSALPRTYYTKDKPVMHFLESNVYKPLSRKIQGQFVHAGIFTGKNKIVEGVGRGFVESSFAKATRGKDYIIVRPKRTKKERNTAAKFAKSQVGKPYSIASLLGASATTAQPAPVRRFVSRLLGKKGEKKAYQCAGMVATAYAVAGDPLDPTTHPVVMAPVHLISNTESDIVSMKLKKGGEPQVPFFPETRRRFQEKVKSAAGYIPIRTEEYPMNTDPMTELVFAYMYDEMDKIASSCGTAHTVAKKMKKSKAKTKKAAMRIMPVSGSLSSAAKNRLMGGAAGMALGLPLGGYMGYRREQKRLSPQEQAVVQQAMAQAYQQGNIAMYNRLKAMAQAKGKAQSK